MSSKKECSVVLNPLAIKRNGTDQKSRRLAALEPSYAPIDDRTIADDLVFTQRLAAYIKYFNNDNAEQGTWQPFFDKDISSLLALIATQDQMAWINEIKEALNITQSGAANSGDAIEYYSKIYAGVFSLYLQLVQLEKRMPDNLLLKNLIKTLIDNKLKGQIEKLNAYLDQAETTYDCIKPDKKTNVLIFGHEPRSLEDSLGALNLTFDELDDIHTGNMGIDPTDKVKRIYYATNHNFFTEIIDTFVKALSKIVEESKKELQKTIENWNSHEPHNALFLSFVQLMTYARQHLNGLTQRHLDLYFKEILRLKNKPAEPNQVHVVFELAKFVDDYLIQKGTILKAGKDESGKEILYQVEEDLAVNTAKITSFKSLFFSDKEDLNVKRTLYRGYASPVTNSANGMGEAFEQPFTAWHPFVQKRLKDYETLDSISSPYAHLGFAFASHYLFLREGIRTITLTLNTDKTISGVKTHHFLAAITTAKGWETLQIEKIDNLDQTLIITCKMTALQPSTGPYDQVIHGASFECNKPVLKLTLLHHENEAYIYNQFKYHILESYSIKVEVDKVKNIYVQNDAGVMDPSKPFLAFGAVPYTGAMLLMGCDEIFQKMGAIVKPVFKWKSTVADFGVLDRSNQDNSDLSPRGFWILRSTDSWFRIRYPLNIFIDGDNHEVKNKKNREQFYIDEFTTINPLYSDENIPFSPKSKSGFVRYNLGNDLGYESKLAERVKYLTDKANGKPNLVSGVFFPPIIQEMWLQYEATTDNEADFFYIYPFGEKKYKKEEDHYMLPTFWHDLKNQERSNGEFYIGLEHIAPPRKLSLLFQLDESSANPLMAKPEDHIQWHYLENDTWQIFDKASVNDQTNSLIQTGIITLNVPKTANVKHHILTNDKIWLKASIKDSDETICKILDILPQAVSAIFTENKNDPNYLSKTLEAQSITKLLEPTPEIKKIQQPFTSFGGRSTESDNSFYLRVSERLRHKNRSINTWDYEHFVLEAFPNIYRTKCISHTRYDSLCGIYNELAPGHVTVIVIPNISKQKSMDPLRPYTFISDLKRIEEYLKSRISPFVKLHVCNPEYEQVRIEASVKFFDEYDKTLFLQRLRDEITRFLAPWAYGDNADIRFENKYTTAMLVNFMEERYYVDFVTEVKLYHITSTGESQKERIEPSRQVAIIVPVSAEKHILNILDNPLATINENNNTNCGCD